MPEQPLIVLKFGGSVLLDEQRLRIAVHEIYRWRRDGYRVLAVVSALAGRTEALIERCSLLSDDVSDLAKASLISTGELESAAFLGVHLDRAGIPASVLTPAAVGFVACGNPLDADPVSILTDPIIAALDTDGVVVFPGFVAVDEDGRTVTLGRGGSDLTAVFLGHALSAERCRLVKDVDGLYDRDPASAYPPPLRYGHAGYDEALETDGSIIQHKAIRFAMSHAYAFELGRFNGNRPTTIGNNRSVRIDSPDIPTPIQIALCGLGTVGMGVLDLTQQLPELFEIASIACKTPSKRTGIPFDISSDSLDIAGSGVDVVVELIGGVDVAYEIACEALTHDSHFVTANKTLIAQRGVEIKQIAERYQKQVLASASVGGVVPVLESLKSDLQVRSVTGVLNGTGNFVLGALGEGVELSDAILEAQRLGFAEADPSRDLDGRDALDKLLVIAASLGWSIPKESIELEAIDRSITSEHPTKHVAYVSQDRASVTLERVDSVGVLGRLSNEWNAAIIEYEDGSTKTIRGKGAGRWPTSESVFADLLALSRERCCQDQSRSAQKSGAES